MTAREALMRILEELPDSRLDQLLDYGRYLSCQEEYRAWQQFGKSQFARAYGRDEPDYTLSDLRKDTSP